MMPVQFSSLAAIGDLAVLILAFKLIVISLGTLFFAFLYDVMATGKATKRIREQDAGVSLMYHHQAVRRVLWSGLITLFVIEGFERFLIHVHDHPLIFWIHLCIFAVPFTAMFIVLRFWLTGERNPVWHRRIVYPCLGFGAIADALGIFIVLFFPR
jgi:hypothetical protein